MTKIVFRTVSAAAMMSLRARTLATRVWDWTEVGRRKSGKLSCRPVHAQHTRQEKIPHRREREREENRVSLERRERGWKGATMPNPPHP